LQRVQGLLRAARRTPGYQDTQVVAELYVSGLRYTSYNNWAKPFAQEAGFADGATFARAIVEQLGIRNARGNFPHRIFLNHAEGGTLIAALGDAIRGGRGVLVVTKAPCYPYCEQGIRSIKEMLKLTELLVVWPGGSRIY
jgi:hypothetical protein